LIRVQSYILLVVHGALLRVIVLTSKSNSKYHQRGAPFILGREGGLAPAAYDSQETIPALGVPIV
jgi:hypothetical protein